MTTSTPHTLDGPGGTRRIRQVRTTAFAGPDAVVTVWSERPAPGPGEVLVAVTASSATTSDSVVRRGLNPYLGALEPPFVLGYDLVGVVEALGPGVEAVVVGDRVAAITRWGANADAVVVPAQKLTRIDSDVDDALVEPMVMTGATAAAMVRRLAAVTAGQTVYVQGGSGGVGLLAVQAALLAGAAVIASASPAKHDALRRLGAQVLDYDDPALASSIRALAPDGVDVVLDAAGGAQSITRGASVLADGGVLITFGFSEASRRNGGRTPEVMAETGKVFAAAGEALAAVDASPRGLRALSFDITTLREEDPTAYSADVHWLLDAVADGRLVPIMRSLPLEQAAEAHRALDAGEVVGRVVLDHRLPAPDAPATTVGRG